MKNKTVLTLLPKSGEKYVYDEMLNVYSIKLNGNYNKLKVVNDTLKNRVKGESKPFYMLNIEGKPTRLYLTDLKNIKETEPVEQPQVQNYESVKEVKNEKLNLVDILICIVSLVSGFLISKFI